jgi:hypothetical protein
MAEANVSEVEFRTLPDFPGYRFGSDGSVWSCFTAGYRREMGDIWTQRKLKHNPRTGYQEIVLATWSSGEKKKPTCRVHLLIAEAFHGARPQGMEACHENGVRTDNRACNIRWDTRKNNHADNRLHGTMMCGESHVFARLTSDTIRAIRQEYAQNEIGYRKLGAKHGIDPGRVRDIVKRKTWKSVP